MYHGINLLWYLKDVFDARLFYRDISPRLAINVAPAAPRFIARGGAIIISPLRGLQGICWCGRGFAVYGVFVGVVCGLDGVCWGRIMASGGGNGASEP